VAYEIVARRYPRIILVTDGEVGNDSVKRCDEAFDKVEKEFKISKSICYIISTGYGEVNMSVTCPFSRFCENQVFTKRRDEPLKAVVQYTADDYKILDSLEEITLENFEAKYDLIEGLIIALNMGKSGNIPLKNQLVSMKNRVVKELSKSMSKQGVDYSQEMRFHLEKGNFEGAIEVAQLMSRKYFSEDLTTDIEKKISYLINLCGDLTGQYSLGQIKSNKMATAATAKEGKLDQAVELQDLSKNPIECPIILDEDVPQILIDEGEPFLLGVEKNVVDDIAACPLRILNYPELRAKFKARLSTFTGVKYADKLLKNPFTQNRLLGAIPLGTHQSHVEVGNHTLAKLVAGGKIMGNLNLYYAVVWYLIAEGEIEFLKPIATNATEHLLHRLRNSKTMAGLCGLAQFVTTQVDSDVAVWYCVSSGYLNQPTDRDTFRFHFYNLHPMIRMVEALGYPLHAGTIAHLNRTRCLLNLLSKFKKMTTKEKKDFKYLFTGLYQNAVFLTEESLASLSEKFKQLEVVTAFVPIDGEASQAQIATIRQQLPAYCSELTLEELHHISTLLDAQKSASDIFLEYNLKVPPLPKPAVNWCYGLNHIDKSNVEFNRKTLRPFYTVHGRRWDECAKEDFKVSDVNTLFKGCKYLENYVLKFEKLPNYAELLLFYFNRYVEAGKESTLPFLAEPWTHDLMEKFNKACEGMEIKDVIDIINSSRPIDKRIFMEES
jgi:hypothetical protein